MLGAVGASGREMSDGCADDLFQEVELLLLFHFGDLDVFGRSTKLFDSLKNVIICYHSRGIGPRSILRALESRFEVGLGLVHSCGDEFTESLLA